MQHVPRKRSACAPEALSAGVGTRCHRSLRAGSTMASPPDRSKAWKFISGLPVDDSESSGETRRLSDQKGSASAGRSRAAALWKKALEAKKLGEEKKASVSRKVSVDTISTKSSVESQPLSPLSPLSLSSPSPSPQSPADEKDNTLSVLTSTRPNRMPWITLLRAVNRFKVSFPDIHRDRILAACDPLLIEADYLSRSRHSRGSVRKIWGDQQLLSKVRTTHQAQRTQVASHLRPCVHSTPSHPQPAQLPPRDTRDAWGYVCCLVTGALSSAVPCSFIHPHLPGSREPTL